MPVKFNYTIQKIVALIMFINPVCCFSQADSASVFTAQPQTMPEFPGGNEKIVPFIEQNIHYPEEAKTKGIEGVVYVSFIINKEGLVVQSKVIKEVNKTLDQEALRVINLMPRWKPAIQNGNPVDIQYNLPIRFNLKAEDRKRKAKK